MSGSTASRAASQKMLTALQSSGAIDHQKLGKVIGDTMPSLLQPGGETEDGDYVATAYSSVVKVYKMMPKDLGALDSPVELKTMGATVSSKG